MKKRKEESEEDVAAYVYEKIKTDIDAAMKNIAATHPSGTDINIINHKAICENYMILTPNLTTQIIQLIAKIETLIVLVSNDQSPSSLQRLSGLINEQSTKIGSLTAKIDDQNSKLTTLTDAVDKLQNMQKRINEADSNIKSIKFDFKNHNWLWLLYFSLSLALLFFVMCKDQYKMINHYKRTIETLQEQVYQEP